MKNILTLIGCLLTLAAAAQMDHVSDTITQKLITKAGKPQGTKTEKQMNKEGGHLISGDKIVELIVPEGALTRKTNISIQPISNEMGNGNGKAYRLEPSGIQFKKPVQLIFHYAEGESNDSLPMLSGIAMQGDDGQWYGLNQSKHDIITKTISGHISHFSDWSRFEALKLYSSSARVKVKKTVDLTIDVITNEENQELSSLGSDELAPLVKKTIAWRPSWYANRALNGNSTHGTISTISKVYAVYKAPASVPDQNPVAIRVDLNGLSYSYKGIRFNDLHLVTNILVYDNAYEVTIETGINGTPGSDLGRAYYKDKGSFVVSLETGKGRIIEKLNNNQIDEYGYDGKCTIVLMQKGYGNIHIADAKYIKVVPPAQPNGHSLIDIEFIRVPIRLSMLKITCPPTTRGGPTTVTTDRGNFLTAGIPAYPMHIRFETKDEEQTLMKIGEQGDDIYVKITVKQVKEDN